MMGCWAIQILRLCACGEVICTCGILAKGLPADSWELLPPTIPHLGWVTGLFRLKQGQIRRHAAGLAHPDAL